MKIDGYKYGRKNNARSWVWNRIEERLSCAKRDAVVVYLAGKEDLDRKQAIRRGFRSENLIAIDTSHEVVEKLRRESKIAIHGNMIDALGHFGGKCKIDVVIADFLGGLDHCNGLRFLWKCFQAEQAFNECPVVAINMQRGLDGKFSAMANDLCKDVGMHQTKHRGEWAYRLAVSFIIHGEEIFYSQLALALKAKGASIDMLFESVLKPAFFSYRSKGSVMRDLVVMRLPWDGIESSGTKEAARFLRAKDKHLSAAVIAAKAVRTMRANGKLPPASMF